MATFKIKIESNSGGIAPSYHEATDDQYLGGVAVDLEAPIQSPYPSMGLVPIRAAKFSSTQISAGAPMCIMDNGRDSKVYVYNDNQKFVSYDNTLGSETLVYTFGAGQANGASYYNNYIYLVSASDVNRYGPLDNSPSMTVSAWTGATLGSQTSLSAANAFPATGSLTYPNHAMHVHNDGKLYFGDYVSASGAGTGRPTINRISSLGDGTLAGGLRRALDLPPGYIVNDIESFGPDLAVLCSPVGIYTAGAIPKTGKAALFLWDTFNSVPYRQIDLPDPLGTALHNLNGQLRVFSGQLDGWVRMTGYTGGNALNPIEYIPEGSPPPPGGVDALGDMLAWVSYGTIPVSFFGAMTKGYRSALLSPTARNCIQSVTGAGTNMRATALAFINKSSKYPLLGWRSDSQAGIDQQGGSATFQNSYWKSKVFNIGQEFEITRIRIPLGVAVDANTVLSPTVGLDDDSSSVSPAQITNTVYGGKQLIDLKTTIKGNTNFNLQFQWAGTTALPVVFPITITVRTLKDDE